MIEIWKMENNHQISIFLFSKSDVHELSTSQQLHYCGQIGLKSPLSGWSSTVALKTGFYVGPIVPLSESSCYFV